MRRGDRVGKERRPQKTGGNDKKILPTNYALLCRLHLGRPSRRLQLDPLGIRLVTSKAFFHAAGVLKSMKKSDRSIRATYLEQVNSMLLNGGSGCHSPTVMSLSFMSRSLIYLCTSPLDVCSYMFNFFKRERYLKNMFDDTTPHIYGESTHNN